MLIALLAAVIATGQPDPILWSTDVSPDGTLVATSGLPTQWLYDADTLAPRAASLPPASATAVDFHPSAPILAVTGSADITGLHNLDTRAFTHLPTEEGARGVDFNHDGTLVAVAGNDGALSVWSLKPAPELIYRDHPENAKSLTGVAWHPTRNTLVTLGEFVTLHDLVGDEPAEPKRITHRPNAKGHCLLLSADWHPSGDFFLISDYGNHDHGDPPTIQFRSHEGELIKAIRRSGAEFRNVRWNPDGTRFAATSDALLVYDAEGNLVHESKSRSNLWGLAWSPDGKTIFTTDQAGRAKRWSADLAISASFGR